jgi:hypothetical protein
MADYNHPDPARRDPVSPAAVNTPHAAAGPSLQPQVHAVAASRTAPRRGTGKLVVGGALIAGIIALWQFGPRFGWGPGGRGPGTGADDRHSVIDDSDARTASSAQKPAQPAQRPLRIQIDGTRYLVDGKETDLAAIAQMARQVPAGDGPAVEITRNGTSRVKAEQGLKAALEKDNLPATWTPPLE